MRSRRITWLFLGFLLVAAAALAAEPDRAAVPSPAAQAQADKLIKDLFKDDFARTKPADRLSLSAKLLQQGLETKDDPAARYVLFREAALLATRAGDVEQALKAVNELTRTYATNGVALKAEVCELAAPAITKPASFGFLAEVALGAFHDALDEDDYDTATRLLKVADAAAARSKIVAVARAVEARRKDVASLKAEAEKAIPLQARLEQQPNDPDTNLAVGKYLCLWKGRWEKGLPHLAKGSDALLKSLAQKDSASPIKPGDQLAVADGWYDMAAGQESLAQLNLQRRAYHWYRMAAPDLTGLNKIRVDKRLAELEPIALAAGTPMPKNEWVVLFRSSDPTIWNKNVNKDKETFAVEVKKAPEKTTFLKLTNVKQNEYAIVAVTADKLLDLSDDGRYGWNGTNKFEYGGRHLGIYDKLGDATKKRGSVCVLVPGAFQGYLGWGFGHMGPQNVPGWTWAQDTLPSSVFEIAVTAGPLTDAEAKKVLKK